MLTVRPFHLLLGVFPLVAALAPNAGAGQLPSLPSVFLDTTPPTQTGKTISVPAGGSLQAALNSANPGDTIELAAGATFTGNFVLPQKSGSGWVWIRTSAYGSLPSSGTRVAPSNANLMAKIISPNVTAAITFDTSASFYRLSGLEITTTYSTTSGEQYGLVMMGTSANGVTATSLSQLPTDVVFDRCYIHGNPTGNIRRGISMNSARTALIDSYISDIHEINTDTQAVAAWNGPGPFAIINNYLEAASENMMFGGGDPSIANLVPSDIEIRGNLISKPLSWNSGDPSYAGIAWTVKNLIELKNAQRLLIDGNVFERIWPAGQEGYAIVLTPRNQQGTAPWSTVQDVTFTNNVVRYAANGVNMLGQDSPNISQRQDRVRIANNLFHHVDTNWLQLLGGVNDVTVQHNTSLQGSSIISADGSPANQGFVFVDNITPNNAYGVYGTNLGAGNAPLGYYFPGAIFTNNAIAGPWPTSSGMMPSDYSNYPNNLFPASLDAVGFVNRASDNYTLSSSSPCKGKASDGTDIGIDFNAFDAAQSGSTASASLPVSPPTSPTLVPAAAPAPGTDTTAPTTSIVSPVSGATVSGIQPIIVTASDNVGVVNGAIMIDGTIVASFSGSGATYNWNTSQFAVGAHTLQSKAQDAAGNVGMSPLVGVTVSTTSSTATTPPSVTITYPLSGTTVAPGAQTITENVSDNVGVTLVQTKINGSVICQKTAPPYSCPVTLSGTGATVDVIAYDAAGNSSTAEVNVRVAAGGTTGGTPSSSSTPDTTPPSVTITYPTSGATVAPGAQTITENVSDNVGVTLVQTKINGSLICQKTAAPYSCPVTLSGTGATVDVIAYDAAGNSSTAEVNVTVAAGGTAGGTTGGTTSSSSTPDTTPPSVTITYPTSGATVAPGAQTITENVSDNVGVTLVQTKINGSLICQKTAPPYSCPVTLSGTGATVDVIAYDAAGNSRTAEVNVRVAP
jgi:hypothetical protein